MDFTQSTIQQAYQACTTSNPAAGTIGIVTCLAILYVSYGIVTTYLEMHKADGSVDRKTFFKLIQKSLFYILFFAAFPFLTYGIENSFAVMQDTINVNYSTGLNSSVDDQISKQMTDYLKKEKEFKEPVKKDKSFFDKLDPHQIFEELNVFEKLWARVVEATTMFCIYILKYLYFFFVCGRYLWLILLQIVGPVALVLSLHKNTFSYFTTWCKNLFLCYLMIPAYMIANVFSESVIQVFMSSQNLNQYGLLAIIGILLLKISMFGIVTKKIYNLL